MVACLGLRLPGGPVRSTLRPSSWHEASVLVLQPLLRVGGGRPQVLEGDRAHLWLWKLKSDGCAPWQALRGGHLGAYLPISLIVSQGALPWSLRP